MIWRNRQEESQMLSTTRNLMWLLFAGKAIRCNSYFNTLWTRTNEKSASLYQRPRWQSRDSSTKCNFFLQQNYGWSWQNGPKHWRIYDQNSQQEVVVISFSILCRPSCKQCLSALSLTTSKSWTKRRDLLGFRREIVHVYHARFWSEKVCLLFSKKTPEESI